MRTRRRLAAFTLIEALVTLAVLGTLLALAVPSFGELVHGHRLTNAANDIFQQLHLARSEAIRRNTRVALCKSADGVSCTAAGGWEQGWILFQDANNTGTREQGEALLERLRPLAPDLRLHANLPLVRYVSYNPFGRTRMASGAFQAGTFTVCRVSTGRVEARKIVINAGGRPRVERVWLESCT